MALEFQPPPTWANPMLEHTDPTTGERKATFNPVWLKWFVDLTSVLTNSGGGTTNSGGGPGTLSAGLPATQIGFGGSSNLLVGSAQFTWLDALSVLRLGAVGGSVDIIGVSDSLGGDGANLSVDSGDGTGNGGAAFVRGGGATTQTGGTVGIEGGLGDVRGGNIAITAGSSTPGIGGDVSVAAGLGGGANGVIKLIGLPTASPGVSGALWRDAGAGNVVKCVP